jgi:hypothetical protein
MAGRAWMGHGGGDDSGELCDVCNVEISHAGTRRAGANRGERHSAANCEPLFHRCTR